MMNRLPRNPADREAKSPCDKNIRYPVCVPGHDSLNGTTFLTIVVYDKQKTALVDDPSDLINTRRLSPGWKPLDLQSWGRQYSCDQVTWIIHSGGFLILYVCCTVFSDFWSGIDWFSGFDLTNHKPCNMEIECYQIKNQSAKIPLWLWLFLS
jgi:hypothetical protein